MQGCGGRYTNLLMIATASFHRQNDSTYVELYLDEVLAIRCSSDIKHPRDAEHSANSWLLSNDYENPGSNLSIILRPWWCSTLSQCIYIKILIPFIHESTEVYVYSHRCSKIICIPIKERKGVVIL